MQIQCSIVLDSENEARYASFILLWVTVDVHASRTGYWPYNPLHYKSKSMSCHGHAPPFVEKACLIGDLKKK